MNIDNLIDNERTIFLQTYNRLPIIIESARGNIIWDEDGTEYRDFIAGLAVNILGHSHPAVVDAAIRQTYKYMHVSNYFYQRIQIEFAMALTQISGYDRVFLTNSGTEANEGAIKLCRSWGFDKDKTEIIAFTGGFHGRTYGPLSLTERPQYKEKMGPFLNNMRIVEYNNSQALEEAVSEKTAGVLFEFIQGEGGLCSVTDEFIETICRLKDKYDFLIITDEIQTGIGRTGKFMASEHWNIKPDIATIAKGIGGGLPLGAILTREHLANVWKIGNHGSTFGGNAVACATGLAVINELQRGIMRNSLVVSDYFMLHLQAIAEDFPNCVEEIRGKGMMLGIVLKFEASILCRILLEEKKIITNATAGNVLRLLPPLITTKEDIICFVLAIRECLQNLFTEII
ncbi:Acetylornithine aminotransferase [bioreactor metagenome]|uniref:Acetylornithine aminotransferase n=1 Tax=bioreactor metagenome TaxID=1076179 RepID=A0A645AI62_9ZZZZ